MDACAIKMQKGSRQLYETRTVASAPESPGAKEKHNVEKNYIRILGVVWAILLESVLQVGYPPEAPNSLISNAVAATASQILLDACGYSFVAISRLNHKNLISIHPEASILYFKLSCSITHRARSHLPYAVPMRSCALQYATSATPHLTLKAVPF